MSTVPELIAARDTCPKCLKTPASDRCRNVRQRMQKGAPESAPVFAAELKR
jgi:hypothetical protein